MCPDESIPDDVKEKAMKATFRALCKHGYADLTMKKIADESDKCKSTFHYHYDTKEKLLVNFIEFLLEGFKDRMVPDTEDPLEKLNGLIDNMLFGLADEETTESFHTALLEIRSQAPYNERYREQITENDQYIKKVVSDIIREGIEKNRFKDVNAEETATVILSAIDGARARQISTNRNATKELRSSLDWIIEDLLLE
ncbi:MAG: TetR/AcrR family transcriptional regulator [Candidatus Thermoplasmatota archaeon]|nr:TetR/AcrR family transcriptional regulator [Candidatus Thermoplasmatota archaeon]